MIYKSTVTVSTQRNNEIENKPGVKGQTSVQHCLKWENLPPDVSPIICTAKRSWGVELAIKKMASLPVNIGEGPISCSGPIWIKHKGTGHFKEGLRAADSKCFQVVTKDGHIPQDDVVNGAVFFW